jgi:hypothetical protein
VAAAIVVRPAELDPELWSKQDITHYSNYVAEVETTIQLLKAFTVPDHARATKLSQGIIECKRILKHIEEVRRGQVDDLNAQVRHYNAAWKPLTDALAAFEKEGNRKLLAFKQAEREREAREAAAAEAALQEKARKEAEALAKLEAAKTPKQKEKATAQVAAASTELMEARLAPALAPPATSGNFRSESGLSASRWTWTFKVTKPEDVPRNYLVVDDKGIRAAIAAGVREIPGVHIFEEEGLSHRIS